MRIEWTFCDDYPDKFFPLVWTHGTSVFPKVFKTSSLVWHISNSLIFQMFNWFWMHTEILSTRAGRTVPVCSWNRYFDAVYELQLPYLLSYRKIEKCYGIVTFFPRIQAPLILAADVAIWHYTTLTHADVNIFLQRWCALTALPPLFLGRSEKRKVPRNRDNFPVILGSTFFVWRRYKMAADDVIADGRHFWKYTKPCQIVLLHFLHVFGVWIYVFK